MRKRSRKAENKGSFDKHNYIKKVLGLRRNKYNNELMCKVSWWAQYGDITPSINDDEEIASPTSNYRKTPNVEVANEISPAVSVIIVINSS